MPRIEEGHAGFSGGIFSLMQDPGGDVHTPGSGAVDSGFVGIGNEGPTANWRKELFQRLEIPKCAVTPWNAFGAYKERPSIKAIKENLPLCQQLLDTALPVAVVAQGAGLKRWQTVFVLLAKSSVCHTRVRVAGPALKTQTTTLQKPS